MCPRFRQAFATCGSPNEVENIPTYGHYYVAQSEESGTYENNQLDYPQQGNSGKSVLWGDVVFHAEDQLRQRVAWVLSQILVTSDSIGRSNEIEPWAVRLPTKSSPILPPLLPSLSVLPGRCCCGRISFG
jgi:hypothetical protein